MSGKNIIGRAIYSNCYDWMDAGMQMRSCALDAPSRARIWPTGVGIARGGNSFAAIAAYVAI
jgi:hypothetical protein